MINRLTFIRNAGALVLAAIVSPAAFAQPHDEHDHHMRRDLEHPEPRDGVTSERVLSVEALGKFANREKIAAAYASARAHPAIYDGIACACSCGDKGAHRSLLVCYESMQATGCGACREEAEVVMKGIADGKTLAEIRAAVDKWAD